MTVRTLALLITIPFGLISLFALYEFGYIGLFEYQLQTSAGWQVLLDLVIALMLLLTWLVPECQRSGRSPLPWIALTLVLGSFGPLLYLMARPMLGITPLSAIQPAAQ